MKKVETIRCICGCEFKKYSFVNPSISWPIKGGEIKFLIYTCTDCGKQVSEEVTKENWNKFITAYK